MSWFDHIVDSLKNSQSGGYPAASASIGGTASTPTPPTMQDPGPSNSLAASAPAASTPSAPVATPAPTKTQSDWSLPPVTMTPPSVAGIPFMQNLFRQAAPQLSMLQNSPMGGILGTVMQTARKQYPFLGMPGRGVGGLGGFGGGGAGSGNY